MNQGKRASKIGASCIFCFAVVTVACGKTGGSSNVAGIYHLPGVADATSLALHEDGTFTLRRGACTSVGTLECGAWKADAAGSAHVVGREGMYWPTPERFPSQVFRSLHLEARDDELVVIGESDWAGRFTQHWERGRSCDVCPSGAQRACVDPLPVCTPPGPPSPK